MACSPAWTVRGSHSVWPWAPSSLAHNDEQEKRGKDHELPVGLQGRRVKIMSLSPPVHASLYATISVVSDSLRPHGL